MAKFGSVKWQKERTDEIMMKVFNGQPLSDTDKAFITIQQEHLVRELKEKAKKKKLKKVM